MWRGGSLSLRQAAQSQAPPLRLLLTARHPCRFLRLHPQDVVLPHVAKSGGMQRLLAEYAALVEELQQREEEEGRGGGADSMDAA